MGTSPFLMGKLPFLMGKSTINGYVSSPEGIELLFSRCHQELKRVPMQKWLMNWSLEFFSPPRSILQGPPRVGGWARMFPEIWAFRNPIFTLGRRMRKRKLHQPIVIVILPFLLCFVLLLPIGFDMFWLFSSFRLSESGDLVRTCDCHQSKPEAIPLLQIGGDS